MRSMAGLCVDMSDEYQRFAGASVRNSHSDAKKFDTKKCDTQKCGDPLLAAGFDDLVGMFASAGTHRVPAR